MQPPRRSGESGKSCLQRGRCSLDSLHGAGGASLHPSLASAVTHGEKVPAQALWGSLDIQEKVPPGPRQAHLPPRPTPFQSWSFSW